MHQKTPFSNKERSRRSLRGDRAVLLYFDVCGGASREYQFIDHSNVHLHSDRDHSGVWRRDTNNEFWQSIGWSAMLYQRAFYGDADLRAGKCLLARSVLKTTFQVLATPLVRYRP